MGYVDKWNKPIEHVLMSLLVDTIDELAVDVEASVELDLALELGGVELVLEHVRHDDEVEVGFER